MNVGLLVSHYNYWVVIFLMMVGFYILISRGNLIKKVVGLNVFQTSVFMLYITLGKITGGTPPILVDDHGGEEGHGAADVPGTTEVAGAAEMPGGTELPGAMQGTHETVADVVYSNPLPHVLILTAIVVGIATTSVALALAIRIKEAYGTVEEDEINSIEAGIEAGG